MDFCGSSLGSHRKHCYLVAEHVVKEASRKMAIKNKKKKKDGNYNKIKALLVFPESNTFLDSYDPMKREREYDCVQYSFFLTSKTMLLKAIVPGLKKKNTLPDLSHMCMVDENKKKLRNTSEKFPLF